eukprot:766488-Prymnesium_polylepis.1
MSVSNRDLHSAENYARATGRNSDGSVRSSLGGRPDLSPLHNCYTRSPRRPAASGSQEFSQLSYAHLHVHVHGHAHAHSITSSQSASLAYWQVLKHDPGAYGGAGLGAGTAGGVGGKRQSWFVCEVIASPAHKTVANVQHTRPAAQTTRVGGHGAQLCHKFESELADVG